MNSERVFVYGTLRRGGSNSFRMNAADYRGEAEVLGDLFLVDWYPALLLGSKNRVKGEVYELSTEHRIELDHFEGVSENGHENDEYRRVLAPVFMKSGREIMAWVWEWQTPSSTAKRLESGDWLDYEPNPS